MSSPLAEAFFLWTILTVVMKHPLKVISHIAYVAIWLKKCQSWKSYYRLGLISFHLLIGGMIPSWITSSRSLQRWW